MNTEGPQSTFPTLGGEMEDLKNLLRSLIPAVLQEIGIQLMGRFGVELNPPTPRSYAAVARDGKKKKTGGSVKRQAGQPIPHK